VNENEENLARYSYSSCPLSSRLLNASTIEPDGQSVNDEASVTRPNRRQNGVFPSEKRCPGVTATPRERACCRYSRGVTRWKPPLRCLLTIEPMVGFGDRVRDRVYLAADRDGTIDAAAR
jgi:hypothetical protein